MQLTEIGGPVIIAKASRKNMIGIEVIIAKASGRI